MTLTDAAQVMVRELNELATWESELLRDLSTTRGRKAELAASLDALVRILPRTERQTVRHQIAAIEMSRPGRSRRQRNQTGRLDHVHDYLAAAEDTVTAQGLQNHLKEQGEKPASGLASIILSRKVDQGVVARLSRGLYRVNPHHPEIVVRRRDG